MSRLKYVDYKLIWEKFVNNGVISEEVSLEIMASWQRLRERGFDAFSRKDYIIPDSELNMRKTNLSCLVSSFFKCAEELKDVIASIDGRFVLFDNDGVVLGFVGEDSSGVPVNLGAYWNEDTVGTTSVSLTLIDKMPHLVSGYQHYCSDFSSLWDASYPVFADDGKFVGVIAMFSNVVSENASRMGWLKSFSKNVEKNYHLFDVRKRLVIAEKYWKAIIEGISDGLILFDGEGNILTMNSKAGEILKVSPNEAVGKYIADIVDFIPVVLDVFKTKKGYVDREFIVKSKRGLLHFIKTAVPVQDDTGKLIAVVDIFREIGRVQSLVTHFMGARAIFTFDDIVGDNKFVKEIHHFIKIAAHSDVPVLIYGPRGVGKEIVAQAIHNESYRRRGPFVTVNCGAMPRSLIEQDLFGSVVDFGYQNSRPGKLELANGGTLFLENVVALPLDIQERLFYTLQKKQILRVGSIEPIPIDIRVIASTDIDLKKEMSKGNFNADFFYYLSVLNICIPPLRKRKSDIPIIVKRLFERIKETTGKEFHLSSDVEELFLRYSWPGNIRELETVIERAVLLSEDGEIRMKDIPDYIISSNPDAMAEEHLGVKKLRDVEIELIKKALETTSGNIYRASKLLGISRSTLYSKMKKYKIV